jgi:hypothetical protein
MVRGPVCRKDLRQRPSRSSTEFVPGRVVLAAATNWPHDLPKDQ